MEKSMGLELWRKISAKVTVSWERAREWERREEEDDLRMGAGRGEGSLVPEVLG